MLSPDRWNFESAQVPFIMCTLVTTLHLCYMRMHSFSANKKHITFSCTLLNVLTLENPEVINMLLLPVIYIHYPQTGDENP